MGMSVVLALVKCTHFVYLKFKTSSAGNQKQPLILRRPGFHMHQWHTRWHHQHTNVYYNAKLEDKPNSCVFMAFSTAKWPKIQL